MKAERPIDAAYLRFLTYRGVEERYGYNLLDESECNYGDWAVVQARIEHELDTIEKAGFPGYFLIVADILRFCRENDIPTGPGRGSICGSAVAYATYITDVEPITFGIPFERFLHLERIAMPDIDLDICQARRGEVIQYLRDTYGDEAVAQIATFTPMAAKGAIRDVCRVLHVDQHTRGVPNNETGERLALAVPEGSGADQIKLPEFLESDEGAQIKRELESLAVPFEGRRISVLDTILQIEGLRRNSSAHAAGVVIADRPIIEIAPLFKRNKDAEVQIQFDMRDAEKIGLLKFDVLGLRTVTVIGDTESLIKKHNPIFSIKSVPLDDKATFQLLSSGDTGAVFQLEGQGITAACTGMQPDRFEDIIALIALYRPGPMEQLGSYFRRKHGEEEVAYAHPDLKPILERTYGLIVYQEQVMGITRTLGGYTAGEADMFRKAIGKKLVPLIKEEIAKFETRAIERGYPADVVSAIGEQVFDFGRYGFNLGHATGYGFITYWTAYLKANYPAEFFTANLNSQMGVLDKIGPLLKDCETHGVAVLPPDINRSGEGFTLTSDGILFGLGGIKGLGDNIVRDIIEERDATEKNQYSSKRVVRVREDGTEYKANIKVSERVPHSPRPFDNPYDFCRRLPGVTITAKRNLVLAGAFGSDPLHRRELHSGMESLNKAAKSGKQYVPDPAAAQLTELELLSAEREILGFYVSSHPLAYYRKDLSRYGAQGDGAFDELAPISTIGGLVSKIRPHVTPKGQMAWLTLETGIDGLPEVTVFSSLWPRIQHDVQIGKVVVVRGQKENHPKFGWGYKAINVRVIDRARPQVERLHISIPKAKYSDINWLNSQTGLYGAEIQLALEDKSGRIALVDSDMRIPVTGALLELIESRGWLVRIDPPDECDLPWPGGLVEKTGNYQGAGEERIATWELPIAQLALSINDGRVIAELKKPQ